VVDRYGSANTEYLKGYRGIDHETGQVFNKSLRGISEGKVHPDYADQNIKQQAGYSAEVAATSHDNAEAVINKSRVRASRSEDVSKDIHDYGKNHPVVDRVKILDGKIIDGSESQMKFVGNRDELLAKIAKQEGKFSRYRDKLLELPSEQYEGAAQHCLDKAQELRQRAIKVEQTGKPEVAEKLRQEADNYETLANNVRDSGLTTEEAIFYRKHPKLATARDIAYTSHRAGVQGAKYGAAIGCTISAVQNLFVLAQGEKELGDAAKDVILDTGKAAALGYGTGFAGSAIGGLAKQSKSTYIRTLGKTNLPALVVNTCVSLSGSIKRYVSGDISEAQMLSEIGETGASMLSSSAYAFFGQLVIPIPIVGGVIGGMIGHTLSSLFYQSALDSARRVEASREHLQRIREIEAAARAHIAEQQQILDEFVRTEIPQLQQAARDFFAALEETGDVNSFAFEVNRFAALMGKQLEFQTLEEFDSFMESECALII